MSTTEALAVAEQLTALAGRRPRFAASDPALGAVLGVVTGGVAVTGIDIAAALRGQPTDATAARLHAAGVDWLVAAAPGADDTLGVTPWLVRVLSTPSLTVYRVRPAVPGADGGTPTAADVVPVAGP